VLKRFVTISILLVLGAAVLLALVRLNPPTRADLFDSPIPTPYAYLPFVAVKAFIPPPAEYRIYLPLVIHEGISGPGTP
jgi:hypothetical protein